MKKFLLGVTIFGVLANAGDSTVVAYEPIKPVIEYKHTSVYIRAGISSLDTQSSTTENITFSKDALDESAFLFDAGINYKFTPNIFVGLEYQSIFLNIAKVQNFLASINYEFDMDTYRPYAGVLYGVSVLDWDKDPDTVLIDRDLESTSSVYGAQIGMKKEIKPNIFATGTYQALSFDHKIDIRNDRSSIAHKMTNNFMVGVQYEF